MESSSFEVRVSRIGVGRTSGHAEIVGVGVADVGPGYCECVPV